MKFKYYLRGAGIGMIVAAVILMIAFSKNNKKLTDDDIIKRAEELGMVMAEEVDNKSDSKNEEPDDGNKDGQGSEDENSGNDNPDGENGQEEKPDDETPDDGNNNNDNNDDNDDEEKHVEVAFEIKDGEFSDVISNHLFEKGLIDDPVKFNDWLIKNRYDGELCTGTFMIPMNSTYEEIVSILIGKVINL